MCIALCNSSGRGERYLVRDLVGNVFACMMVSIQFILTLTLIRTSGLLEHAAGSVGDLLVDRAELVGVLTLLLLKSVHTLSGCEYGDVRCGYGSTDLVEVVLLAASSRVSLLGCRHDEV
jgi:hypothetical protein